MDSCINKGLTRNMRAILSLYSRVVTTDNGSQEAEWGWWGIWEISQSGKPTLPLDWRTETESSGRSWVREAWTYRAKVMEEEIWPSWLAMRGRERGETSWLLLPPAFQSPTSVSPWLNPAGSQVSWESVIYDLKGWTSPHPHPMIQSEVGEGWGMSPRAN